MRCLFLLKLFFSHPSKLELIKSAKEKGYKTYLYFIGTDTPIINLERIHDRIKKGGHPVSEVKIKDRYYKTMDLLLDILELVDESYIWDNSQSRYEFIAYSKNKSLNLKKLEVPKWMSEYFFDKIL
ncbi:MAG: hypothetical protein ABIP95_15770 [Pelobium sp.]